MKKVLFFVGLMLLAGMTRSVNSSACAQERPWSGRAANAAIARWPDGRLVPAGVYFFRHAASRSAIRATLQRLAPTRIIGVLAVAPSSVGEL